MNRMHYWRPDDSLKFRTLRLEDMESIAKYSFVAHKSINYLDLSLREYSSLREKRRVWVPLMFCSADPPYSKKFVGTSECCRKTMILERRWLYTLHLDLPIGREAPCLSLCKPNCGSIRKPRTCICFNKVTVPEYMYQVPFRFFIAAALEQNGMEMNFVRRQMALMKRVLKVRSFQVDSIEDRILNFLYPTCTDTQTVLEFLDIIDFNSWVLQNQKQDVLEYLLHHAHLGRYDLKLTDKEGILVNECFFNLYYKSAELLLQYHNAPCYYNYDCTILNTNWHRESPNDWFPEDLRIPYEKGLLNKRRYLLWIQVCHAYTVKQSPFFIWPKQCCGSATNALRLLWRSLPDAHFTLEELNTAYKDVPSVMAVNPKVYEFYVQTLAGDLVAGRPRSLQHNCRVSIRRSLCYNLQLPYGISRLRAPSKLQAFIRLEE